ncbi:MAG: PaaX family transcriptional regulator C-terminal domain-containing protein [Pseudomonadota bacterium]
MEITADLRALGGGRVWSLMVSLFGDLAQGRGQAIDGPVLSRIMAGLGVKPEAARVALHRLRNDGWIASEKRGRTSRHSLTPKGRSESAAASPRIYARPEDAGKDWRLVLAASTEQAQSDTLARAGFTQVMPRVFVGPTTAPVPEGALAFSGNSAPDWLCHEIAPTDLLPEYTRLNAVLTKLLSDLLQLDPVSALDTAVLRCLVVHNWRRLVLKHPAMPTALMPDHTPITACHATVDRFFTTYPRPALRAISSELET